MAGCSEPPEQRAAKKISQKADRARKLMEEQTEASLSSAAELLQEALATPSATIIGKRPANELLGALLSQATARQLSQLDEKQREFAKADTALRLIFRKLSIQAGTFARAEGFKITDDSRLREYRQELGLEIPKAMKARDAAAQVTVEAQAQLAQTKEASAEAVLEAERLLLGAEDMAGEEYVERIKKGTEMRLNADMLLIKARNEELDLISAREIEARHEAILVGLQTALQGAEELITAHARTVATNKFIGEKAQAGADIAAEELIGQLEKFADLGEELSQGYRALVDQQGRSVGHYQQALRAGQERRRKFRSYQGSLKPGAPRDDRVQSLTGSADGVALAMSVARAKVSLAQLRIQQAGVLERALSRIQQMQRARKDLAVFGRIGTSAEVPAEPKRSGGFGFFQELLTKSEKAPPTEKPITAAGILIAAPKIDTENIAEDIWKIKQAGLEDLDSAISTVRTAAGLRQKQALPSEDAEADVKALERNNDWNWQVWGMLGLAHQQRAALQLKMGQQAEASEDTAASQKYFSAVGKVRPNLFRPTHSN